MKLAPAALCAGFCAIAYSQSYDTFRANITGVTGDRGKCTVEVVVDGAAEVEITGSQGRMRTLSGARAAWRRLDCSLSLPPNPANFKFTGKDSHGTQTLVHAPAGNQGAAIVRIEDPETGSRSHKFTLEWNGVTGGFESGGLTSGGLKNSGQGGIIEEGGLAGWADQIEFRGPGEGYYHSFHGADEILADCEVLVDRSAHVQIRLQTKGKDSIMLTGRLVKADNKNLVANVSGGTVTGPMEIVRDSRNHIKTLYLSGEGRNKSELRWRSDK